jgi:hypothetical protein
MIDIEEEIAKCQKHYAYMDGFRAWWIKWVLPTKRTVPDPKRKDELITYYEDVYNILMRRSDARDELTEMCIRWSKTSLPQTRLNSLQTEPQQ